MSDKSSPDTESDEEDETEMQFSHFNDLVHQTSLFVNDELNNKMLDESAVIMDSGSTTNLFEKGGRYLLNNFRWDKKGVRIKYNKGVITTHWMADYESFPVWYHKEAIFNMMSLSAVSKKYKVTFDSSDRGGVF